MPLQVYRVRPVDRPRLDAALGDDILSRQSLQLRDSRHYGITGDWLYLFVEGSEAGILRADALLLDFAERAPDADVLWDLFRAEEDEAATSLGSLWESA